MEARQILFWGDDSGGTAASVCKTLADRKGQALGSHTCRSRRRRIAQRAKALVSTVGCTTDPISAQRAPPRASPAAVTKAAENHFSSGNSLRRAHRTAVH